MMMMMMMMMILMSIPVYILKGHLVSSFDECRLIANLANRLEL